jgi:hypothetical protein
MSNLPTFTSMQYVKEAGRIWINYSK